MLGPERSAAGGEDPDLPGQRLVSRRIPDRDRGFCVDPNSNRNLLDFNSETVDPTTGFAHIAYADDSQVNKLRVANQVSGSNIGH